MSVSTIRNLLDMPDEILVKIIGYIVPRERIIVGESCARLKSLILCEKQLLRNLDFSKNGRLVKLGDIGRYLLSGENNSKNVRVLCLRNVKCLKSVDNLTNLIVKATNLVELDIHGTKFKNVEELSKFLIHFTQLEKLSVDWPMSEAEDVSSCVAALRQPFGGLTYLSVRIYLTSPEFFPVVQFCAELRELRIKIDPFNYQVINVRNIEFRKLRNLEIVQVCGTHSVRHLKSTLIDMLLDPYEWTEFQVVDVRKNYFFYIERNVDVCDEFLDTELKEAVPYHYMECNSKLGWFMIAERLLAEVMNITHENVPETFCCFRPARSKSFRREKEPPYLITIDDAKRLLTNPWHQISSLHFNHVIKPNCDAHLVASAFPNITEIFIVEVAKKNHIYERNCRSKTSARRLRRRGDSSEFEDPEFGQTNRKSCFEMLVENTPRVKHVTIFDTDRMYKEVAQWDLDALYLIANWRNMTTLRLAWVYVIDGKFLIHIGIRCPNLEVLMLESLGFGKPCCYTNDLCEMLTHCRNLREFSLHQDNVCEVSEILDSLADNPKLEEVCLVTKTETYNMTNIVTSIEGLLNSCKNLTTFIFILSNLSKDSVDQLASLLRSLRIELNRPNFQFQLVHLSREEYYGETDDDDGVDRVFEDEPTSFFPRPLEKLYHN